MSAVHEAALDVLDVWVAGEEAGGEHDLDRLDAAMSKLADAIHRGDEVTVSTEEILSAELVSRGRRTGLIWAVPLETTGTIAIELQRQLQERFPDVVCAVAPGPAPLAFEWDEPEDES